MKKKKIIPITIIIVFILFAVKGFLKSDRINIIDDVIVLDNSADITDNWRLVLVNSKNSVPKDYKIELTQLSNGVCVDSRIYPDLQQMFDDAREQGIYPVVSEGYRTYEEQQSIMNDKINCFIDDGYSEKEAIKFAEDWVAVPGTSEHELGIALDINADTSASSDEEVYEWLADNAYRYGFILRYPPDKEHITGIDYEPWHYRYVGTQTASEIYSRQITLEEYLGVAE